MNEYLLVQKNKDTFKMLAFLAGSSFAWTNTNPPINPQMHMS